MVMDIAAAFFTMCAPSRGLRAALCIVLGWQATICSAVARVQIYEQHWTAASDATDPASAWSVDAEMRIGWVGVGQFGYKSIADPSLRDSISALQVSDGSGQAISFQSYANSNGWTIVKIPTPPALVVVRYKIAQAVCAVELEDEGASRLRFAAPWAGYWTIPVTGVSYSFTAPGSAEQVTATVAASSPASISTGTTTTLTQQYTAEELQFGGGDSSPRTAAFEWAQRLSSTVRRPGYCDGSGGSGGLGLGAIAGIAVAFMLLSSALCYIRSKKKQQRQQANRPAVQLQVVRAVPMAAAAVQPVPVTQVARPVSLPTVTCHQAPGTERAIPMAKLVSPPGYSAST